MGQQVLKVEDDGGQQYNLATQASNGDYGVRTVDPDVVAAIESLNSLTGRLLARNPVDGYMLWLDTEDSQHIYILEAPVSAGASDVGFRGIRITKSTLGNPVGPVETNTAGTLTFDNRTTDGGW